MLKIIPEKIIDLQKSMEPEFFRSKRPIELLNTGYVYGQTLILKGSKKEYLNAEEFWLACISWYNSDGEDTFFQDLIFEDLTSIHHKKGLNNESNLKSFKDGIIEAMRTPESFDLEKISRHISGIKIENLVIMNPIWNEEKILFMDEENFYLYYFWTGE